jgi:hypothetical protein
MKWKNSWMYNGQTAEVHPEDSVRLVGHSEVGSRVGQ